MSVSVLAGPVTKDTLVESGGWLEIVITVRDVVVAVTVFVEAAAVRVTHEGDLVIR